jgi:mono/diheme cytochrome c family protein
MFKLSRVYLFLVILFSFQAWAVDCPTESEVGSEAKSVQAMVKNADSYSSVEEFIQALPETLRSNFIMLADSRSFHASNRDNPRVLLASPDGQVRVSFNTEPGSRGFNGIEISMWNNDTQSFDYKEVAFKPQEGRLHANEDPGVCIACHGNPPKPNLEDPDRWNGAVPFRRDSLVAGTQESEWFQGYLNRIESAEPRNTRLNALKPLISSKELQEQLTQEGQVKIPYAGVGDGTLTESIYKKNAELMRCSQASRLKRRPNYDNLKYLLAGLKNKCEPSAFMNDWYFEAAQKYYKGRIPGLSVKGATSNDKFSFLQTQVIKDTQLRQIKHKERSEGRQKSFWLQEFINDVGSDEGKTLLSKDFEKNKIKIPDDTRFKDNAFEVGTLRLMLEPLGVQVSRFSTALDPFDYSFGGNFSPDYILEEDFQEILKENTGNKPVCEFLADRNRDALEGVRERANKFSEKICVDALNVDVKITELVENNRETINVEARLKAQQIMTGKCLACHSSQSDSGTLSGAPVLPFDDAIKMEQYFASPEGTFGDMKEVMKDRINRPMGHHGSMPVPYVTNLSVEDKAYLNIWLDSIKE